MIILAMGEPRSQLVSTTEADYTKGLSRCPIRVDYQRRASTNVFVLRSV